MSVDDARLRSLLVFFSSCVSRFFTDKYSWPTRLTMDSESQPIIYYLRFVVPYFNAILSETYHEMV